MALTDLSYFRVPTQILAGPGLVRDFGTELERLGMTRALIVTERYFSTAGVIERVAESLSAGHVELAACFDEVVPDSDVALAQRGAALAREARADGVVAVGGGSTIDTAKVIDILLTHGGELLDYQGVHSLPGPLLPLVAVPTTAGTGSEVSHVAVVLDRASAHKISFVDHNLTPALAVLDPELTFSLPARVTAATGMDALTHAVEAFLGTEASPFSDAMALAAVRLIADHILEAVDQPDDVNARSAMMTASTMAGIAFRHSMVGVVHAMAHAMGALCRVPHGEANAIMLPYGMEFCAPARRQRLVVLADAFGPRAGWLTASDPAMAAVDAVRGLVGELHDRAELAATLGQAGVSADRLESIAALAMEDGSIFYSPRPVEQADVAEMLRRAL